MTRRTIALTVGLCLVLCATIAVLAARFSDPRPPGRIPWQAIDSPRWQFDALFPSDIETDSRRALLSDTDLHEWWSWHGGARFTVVLTFLPQPRVNTDEDVYTWGAEMTVNNFGGVIDRDEPITRNGYTGRRQKLVTDLGIVESNVFIVEDRMYHAQVAYPDGALDDSYFEYFFANFNIHYKK